MKTTKELNKLIYDRKVKTFLTKKEAKSAAVGTGFKHIIRIERRFEKIWVIGKDDILFDAIRILTVDGVLDIPRTD